MTTVQASVLEQTSTDMRDDMQHVTPCSDTDVVQPSYSPLLVFKAFLLIYYYVLILPLHVVSTLSSSLRASLMAVAVVWCPMVFSSHRLLIRLLQAVLLRFYGYWMCRGYVHDSLVTHRFGPSVSFAGGGMLWPYYLGVAHHIFTHYDISKIKIFASSGGCFGAVPLAMGWDPYVWCKRDWPKCVAHYDSRTLGPLCDALEFYRDLWDQYLPEDAHLRASGRLHLSITLFPSFVNRVVTDFATRADLIECICASTCLPLVFLRTFPRTSLGLAVDGGLTNDQPVMDRYTVTCSVLNEQAQIYPSTRFSPLDLLRAPTIEAAFATADRAAAEAASSGVFEARHEWKDLKRPCPTSCSCVSATTAKLTTASGCNS